MKKSIAHLIGITKIYDDRDILNNISMKIHSGQLILLLGPSGSGKTTILTLCAGLIGPSTGDILLFGKRFEDYTKADLQYMRSRKIGFVFQNFNLLNGLTVLENVMVTLRFSGKNRTQAKSRAELKLKDLDIWHLKNNFPVTLSQGEKQRVAIARALAPEPEFIIADEPTASLGTNQGFEVIKILSDYSKQKNKCVLVASHDLRLRQFADRILSIENGEIVDIPDAETTHSYDMSLQYRESLA
jgi:putative ABC transport system ATP-binding protein